MEKHNTHIVLDSLSSERHDYKGDENGNIKVDSSDDAIYHSYIKKKAKSSIRQILIDNNNIIKKEFEDRDYPEVILKKQNTMIEKKKSTKIKKIKKIKTESDEKVENEKNFYKNRKNDKNDEVNLIKIKNKNNKKAKVNEEKKEVEGDNPEEYKYDMNTIKPCCKEVDMFFKREPIKSEENSMSYREKNKIDNDINKKKRNTVFAFTSRKNKFENNEDNNDNKSNGKKNNSEKFSINGNEENLPLLRDILQYTEKYIKDDEKSNNKNIEKEKEEEISDNNENEKEKEEEKNSNTEEDEDKNIEEENEKKDEERKNEINDNKNNEEEEEEEEIIENDLCLLRDIIQYNEKDKENDKDKSLDKINKNQEKNEKSNFTINSNEENIDYKNEKDENRKIKEQISDDEKTAEKRKMEEENEKDINKNKIHSENNSSKNEEEKEKIEELNDEKDSFDVQLLRDIIQYKENELIQNINIKDQKEEKISKNEVENGKNKEEKKDDKKKEENGEKKKDEEQNGQNESEEQPKDTEKKEEKNGKTGIDEKEDEKKEKKIDEKNDEKSNISDKKKNKENIENEKAKQNEKEKEESLNDSQLLLLSEKLIYQPDEINDNKNQKKDEIIVEANESIIDTNKTKNDLLSKKPQKENDNDLIQGTEENQKNKLKAKIINKGKNNNKINLKDISNNSESIDKFLKVKEKEKITNNSKIDVSEDKFIKEPPINDNNGNKNIFKSENVEFIFKGSKKKNKCFVDDASNTEDYNGGRDLTLEIERKINNSFRNDMNGATVGSKGNSFRKNAKDFRSNKKYATFRENNDSKIMLLLEPNKKINFLNKKKAMKIKNLNLIIINLMRILIIKMIIRMKMMKTIKKMD